jgi:tRNA threonylcarbamoyladenosine biosynthesis protein TsaB
MWLALDTATARASVALGQPGQGSTALEANLTGARRHAAGVLPMVQDLLRQAGRTLADLRGVALSDGPGSFTGLRVGAAVAKALVHARELPLLVAPSLLVRARGMARPGALVLAIADALRGEVYAAAYRFTTESIATVLSPSVRRSDDLVELDIRPDFIVGEAPPMVLSILEQWAGTPVIGGDVGAPRASRLLDLVGEAGGAREVTAVSEWEPVYGRPAEAQARWETVHGRPLPHSVGSPG